MLLITIVPGKSQPCGISLTCGWTQLNHLHMKRCWQVLCLYLWLHWNCPTNFILNNKLCGVSWGLSFPSSPELSFSPYRWRNSPTVCWMGGNNSPVLVLYRLIILSVPVITCTSTTCVWFRDFSWSCLCGAWQIPSPQPRVSEALCSLGGLCAHSLTGRLLLSTGFIRVLVLIQYLATSVSPAECGKSC